MFRKLFYIFIIFISTFFMVACSRPATCGMQVLSTHMDQSSQIEFNDVPQSARTVFLDVKNQTGNRYFNLTTSLTKSFQLNGYQVVNKARYAHFVIHFNILLVGHASEAVIQAILNNGYGGDLQVCMPNSRKTQLAVAIADLKINEKALYMAGGKLVQQTRMAVIADKVNVKIKDAEPALASGLIDSFGNFM